MASLLLTCRISTSCSLITYQGKQKNARTDFYLRWCRARDLFGSKIPVITGGFELRISCIQSRYLTPQVVTWKVITYLALWPSELGNDFVCKRFAVQTLLWFNGICNPNKSRARDHPSLKLGSDLKYLDIDFYF